MKEHPILFSAPMVRAILDNRKTQTRRVVKGIPSDAEEVFWWAPEGGIARPGWADPGVYYRNPRGLHTICPPWRVGDKLWARETAVYWTYSDGNTGWMNPVAYCDDAQWQGVVRDAKKGPPRGYTITPDQGWWKIRPSIHMPRWASRITLEVTGVRAERVQRITEADAVAEGMDPATCESALSRAAGKITPLEAWYANNAAGSENSGWLCIDCAEKFAGKAGRVQCGCTPESDGPAFCDECCRPLAISLTEYGINIELRMDDDPDGKHPELFPCVGSDAAIAAMIAGGIGDLCDEHKGRLAQIGFSVLWDSINAARGYGWDANPWVWVIEFKREVTR